MLSDGNNQREVLKSPLGQRISDHAFKPELLTLFKTIFIIGLTGSFASIMWAVWRWLFTLRQYGPAALGRWLAAPLGAVVGFISIGLVGLWQYWRRSRSSITLFEGGLVLTQGHENESIPWEVIDQIHTTSVRYGFPGLTSQERTTIDVFHSNDRKVRLSQALVAFDALVETVKRRVYAVLLTDYARKLNQGDTLAFGPLTLSKEGVKKDQHFVRWHDVQNVSLSKGQLELVMNQESQDIKMKVSTRSIPNVELCYQLLQLLGERT